jgi:hypothetical protein
VKGVFVVALTNFINTRALFLWYKEGYMRPYIRIRSFLTDIMKKNCAALQKLDSRESKSKLRDFKVTMLLDSRNNDAQLARG